MKIFFIGIGGISMSGIAVICKSLGYGVSGSDRNQSQETEFLKSKDIEVYIGHNSSHITDDIDIVCYTAAIPEDNVELITARKKNITTLERADFLGKLMHKYDFPIAISGTHGKTTTTSIITHLFNFSKKNPTALIGGNFKEIGGNVEIGNTKYFITEACEYVDSFLKFFPQIGIITNIEEDHLDYFKNIEQIKSSFLQFSNQIKDGGFVVACGDNKNTKDCLKNSSSKVYYYGFDENNDFVIKNLVFDSNLKPSFEIYENNKLLSDFKISLYGKTNVLNSTAAIATAYLSGIDIKEIKESIKSFYGVNRRFEYKGSIGENIRVYDDYAHHPTEIKATIGTASKLKKTRLITCFQPHTYTRTKSLFDEFKKSFDDSDIAIFADIFAAREVDDGTINSRMLSDACKKRGVNSYYFSSFDEIYDFLKQNLKPDDLFFTIGAGDIYKLGEMLIKNYDKK